MKFFNLLLIFILAYEVSNAQIVNIPDPNFKTALIDEGVDTNNDGEIQVSEAEAVLSLNVSNRAISSLEGIQSFINLEDLFCSNNELSESFTLAEMATSDIVVEIITLVWIYD